MASLAPRRFLARSAIHSAIGLVAAVTAAIFVASTAYLQVSSEEGARELISAAPSAAASLVVRTHLSDDAGAQDTAAKKALGRQFAGVPIDVVRTAESSSLPVEVTGVPDVTGIILVADATITTNARLETGSWPASGRASAAIPTTVQADAARALGLAVGDSIDAGSPNERVTLSVVGTWVANDATAARWHGDSAVASGFDAQTAGPFLVDESAIAALPTATYAQWVVVPRVNELTVSDISRLASTAAITDVSAAIDRYGGVKEQSTTVTGGLAATADRAARVVSAASAVSAVPLALSAAIALVTLIQLAGLLGTARVRETWTLRARGASVVQLTGWAARESIIGVLPGVALGWVAASLAFGGFSVSGAVIAGVVVAGAVVVLTLRSFGTLRSDASVTTRPRAAATVAVVVTAAVVLAAALAIWQLLLYGADRVSAFSSFGPTLAIVAVILVLGSLLGPIATIASSALAAAPSLTPTLAARQVARQARVFSVATLVIALATGSITLAATFSGTLAAVDDESAIRSTGADVRASVQVQGVISDGTVPITSPEWSRLDSATSAAVALSSAAAVGADDVQLVSLASSRFVELLGAGNARFDSRLHSKELGTASPGIPVSGSVLSVSVKTNGSATQRAGVVIISAWLVDEDGALARVRLGAPAVADTSVAPVAVSGDVPAAAGAWSLLAFDAELQGSPGNTNVIANFSGLADGVIAPPVTLSSIKALQRSLLIAPSEKGLPVVVSDSLAARNGYETGSTFSLVLPTAGQVTARVVGTSAVIPGAANPLAVIADLPTLSEMMVSGIAPVVQPADIWFRTTDDAATSRAAILHSRLPAAVSSSVSVSVSPVLDPTSRIFWTAVVGIGVIALIALAATIATIERQRRRDTSILRALGMSARTQSVVRAGELGAVALFAVIIGIAAALVTALVTVGTLAKSAVPGSTGGLVLPVLGSAWAPLGLAALVVTIVIAVYCWQVARSAGRPS